MPTAVRVPPITTEQYERFEGYPGLKDELIYGEIFLSPQPKPLHQQVSENVHRALQPGMQAGFTAKQNTNIRFREANSMPAPDVFVIAKNEWKRACAEDDYLSEAPVLVVEVLSPANRSKRIEMKVDLYLSHGVQEIWLLSPKKKTMEIAGIDGRRFVTGRYTLPEPLAGTVDIAALFIIEG